MAIKLPTLKKVLRTQVKRAGGIRKFGRLHDIQPSRICEALDEFVEPTPQVVSALGYRKARAMYEKVDS